MDNYKVIYKHGIYTYSARFKHNFEARIFSEALAAHRDFDGSPMWEIEVVYPSSNRQAALDIATEFDTADECDECGSPREWTQQVYPSDPAPRLVCRTCQFFESRNESRMYGDDYERV